MAGTVTITEELLSNIKKITFVWTASAGGAADGTTTNVYSGLLAYVVTVPGAGGDAPTDNYDVTLVDESSIDVGIGQLANRDTANTEWVVTGMGTVVGDTLTLHVTNAGNAKTGTVVAYIAPAGQSIETSIAALYGADGIASFPAAAAAGNGVSLAEVLRYIQESQIGTLTNTGGTATLGGIVGDVANSSIATRLTAIAAATSGGVDGRSLARRTYSFAIDNGAQGAKTMFTVTGTVVAQVLGVCQSDLTGVLATVELGIAGNTAALIAQAVATSVDQYQTWQDATPEANPGPVVLTNRNFIITNGADIILTIATADLTAGIIDFYCLWSPLSSGATVVAA